MKEMKKQINLNRDTGETKTKWYLMRGRGEWENGS